MHAVLRVVHQWDEQQTGSMWLFFKRMSVFRGVLSIGHGKYCARINSSLRFKGEICWRHHIVEHTEISRDHLTPEIPLHLITPNCPLWHLPENKSKFSDPFWAFYWPGGQALTRFILDNPDVVRGKSILDVGSGCGASSIAARMRGAAHVTANDIDHVAIEAIRLNCALNSVSVETITDDLIGENSAAEWDVIFLGDMFYDEEFTDKVRNWIDFLMADGKSVFIGDPGRTFLQNHSVKTILQKVFEIELLDTARKENSGFSHGYVWKAVS